MTIATTSNKAIWQGNGSTTVFPFTFEVGNVSEITLYYTSGGSVTTIPSSSYSVSGLGAPSGGTITYPLSGSPIAQGTSLTLIRTVPLQQLTDLVNQSNYFPDAVEGALDYEMMAIQQIAQEVSYCLQTPESDPVLNLTLPNAAARAGTLVGFDAFGNAITYPITASVGAGNMTPELGANGRPGFKAGVDFTAGTTNTLTLSKSYGTVGNVFVAFDGAYQERDSYQLNGAQITFGTWVGNVFTPTAIPVGVNNVDVIGGTTLSVGIPAAGSVGSSQLAPGAVLAAAIQQPASEQLYVGNGAQINRMNDRLFVGDATVNSGDYPITSQDWLTALQAGTFGANAGSISFAQLAVLQNQQAGSAITAAAQTKHYTSPNSAAIGIQSFGYANNGTYGADAWAYYGEAHRLSAADGSAYAIEVAVVNRSGASVLQTPYTGPLGLTTGIQIDSGNSFSATQEPGLAPASSAMTIVQNTSDNSAPFLRGIIFSVNSLQNNSGISEAISFYEGCALQWYGPTGSQTSSIYCQGTTGSAGVHQVFQDNQIQFLNGAAQTVFSINSSVSGGNSIGVAPAASGATPIIEAQGGDTNIGITLQMKGSASLALSNTALAASASAGGASTLPASPAEYLIVYLNGSAYKIPCYNN